MSWTFFLLAKHPEWQEKLRQEIREKLGDELPTFKNVLSIPLATMIIKESLRLYPPVSFVGRVTRQATEFGGHPLPAEVHFLNEFTTRLTLARRLCSS